VEHVLSVKAVTTSFQANAFYVHRVAKLAFGINSKINQYYVQVVLMATQPLVKLQPMVVMLEYFVSYAYPTVSLVFNHPFNVALAEVGKDC
jgi:hypothetical protein